MGTGYTRQSSGFIIDSATIEASHFNTEFNQLESAFNSSTGHSHDGTTGEGPLISLSSSITGTLAIGNGGTGATTKQGAVDALFAGGIHVDDDIFFIADPVDNTKRYRIDVGAVTTGTDRVLTLPDSNVTVTTFAGTILDDANASAARTTLGVAIGSDVQAYDATLAALASYNTNGLITQTAADTFTGRTITGTADRVTVTNGNGVSGNPTLDIASTYVGQSSITTLGTITTGVWNGTEIAVANGGTGSTTASGALTNLGAQASDAILDDLSGITFAQGDILYYNGTNLVKLAAGTSGDFLKTQGAGSNPIWDTVATPSTEFEDSTFRVIDNADNSKELAFEVSGITTATTRTWTVPDSNITFGAYAPTILNTANEAGFKQAVNLEIGTDVQAYDALLNSMAGLSVVAGDLIYGSGADTASRLAKGTAGQVLTMNAGATAPEWAAAAGGGLKSTQVFTASGTWNRPSGVTKVIMFVTGGGGGDIGDGGNSSWSDGTNTITGNGGSRYASGGGAGGSASGGDINISGGKGGDSNETNFDGIGGSSFWGGTGAYGAGGPGRLDNPGCGGAGTAIKFLDVSSISSATITVGAAGSSVGTSPVAGIVWVLEFE